MKRKIITVANQKGGVGKTTTAVNIAAGLTAKGNKVLCIDLDPQGNLSEYLGFDGNGETISDLLLKVCTNTPFNATLAIRESFEGIWG